MGGRVITVEPEQATDEGDDVPRTTRFINGRIFTSAPRAWAEALVVHDDRLLYVGDADTATRLAPDSEVVDLEGRLVTPGFVDGHAHVLMTGKSLHEVDLWGVHSLEEIQQRILAWREAHPDAVRIEATGWPHQALPGGKPTKEMLDAVVADVPIYAVAFDYHSLWCNSAALDELALPTDIADPQGGTFVRDASGAFTGHIDEAAYHQIVRPIVEKFADEADHDRDLAAVQAAYARVGVTASADMSFEQADLETFLRAEAAGTLTTRVHAYWRVHNTGDLEANLAAVAHAARMAAEVDSERLRIVGIKIIVDGTIDGCTATLKTPYANGTNAEPIWPSADLDPVVVAADAAGLSVAMHAIGDESVNIAINAVEAAVRANGPKHRRHRIEHLELVDRADVARLADLGITASMQPVHCDPAIAANWRAQLGDSRVDEGFAWPWFVEADARLAFGTDSPTSPYPPLPNMYVATTRKSALEEGFEPNIPEFALPLAEAIRHATADSAYACWGDAEYGSLQAGKFADFVVLDTDVLAEDPSALLTTNPLATYVGGRRVFAADEA